MNPFGKTNFVPLVLIVKLIGLLSKLKAINVVCVLPIKFFHYLNFFAKNKHFYICDNLHNRIPLENLNIDKKNLCTITDNVIHNNIFTLILILTAQNCIYQFISSSENDYTNIIIFIFIFMISYKCQKISQLSLNNFNYTYLY